MQMMQRLVRAVSNKAGSTTMTKNKKRQRLHFEVQPLL